MLRQTKIPPGPGGWWTGERGDGRRWHPLRDGSELARTFGDIVRLRFRCKTIYQVTHPAACHDLLVTQASLFVGTHRACEVLPRFFDGWCAEEQVVFGSSVPRLRADELSTFCHSLTALTKAKIQFGHVRIFNIHEVLSDLTIQAIAKTLLGKSVDPHGDMLREAFQPTIDWPSTVPPILRVEIARRHEARVHLRMLLQQCIDERRSFPPTTNDWLMRLMIADATAPAGGRLTRGVPDQVVSVISLVRNTMTDVLTWAAYRLAHEPALQREVADQFHAHLECDPCAGGSRTDSSPLDRILWETLRLYPAQPILLREATEATELFGYEVPRRTICIVPVHLMHRDPRWHETPERFCVSRPFERLLETSPRAFLPFGFGTETCFLRQFVMLGGAAVLATILQNYSIVPIEGFAEPSTQSTQAWRTCPGPYVQLRRRR